MATVTIETLQKIMPKAPKATLAECLPPLLKAMAEFEINTPLRMAAFIAQITHESGELRYFREIWGPTEAQKRYENRKDLGNIQPGDGYRYRGRGVIQLTGRANYRAYGEKLGLPLEAQPDMAEQTIVAFRVAGRFWADKGLNALADQKLFKTITKYINGGFNGLADREAYYRRALEAFR